MTEKEIADYLASPEYARLVATPEFHQRGVELERRLATEALTVQAGADIMGLPVDVFRHLYGHFLALEAVKKTMGTAQ